jgi:vanillate O-demethylase monooxygenase subunit
MEAIRNAWYVAGFAQELTADNVVARRLLDIPVVLMRTSGGAVAALEDLCPHRLMPLSMGRRVGDELQCGYHGLRFAANGACTDAPGQAVRPAAACVRTFPLAERHGLLWFWPGAPERADAGLIPDMRWNEHPGWAASRGYHHIRADFRLLNDNLLDLSHESYIHRATIGNDEEETIASYPVEVGVEHDCMVRAHREMPNIEPPPFFVLVLDHRGRIHRWQTAIHVAPCSNMTDVGAHPAGTPRSGAIRSHVLHLLTPETPTTTHYFWAFARNYRLDDAALTESVRRAIDATFSEDRVVLEVQQKQLERYGGPLPRAALKLDEAPMRARKLLEKLVRREREDPGYRFVPPPMVDDEIVPPQPTGAGAPLPTRAP